MDASAKPIAVVQGATSAVVQRLLADFVARHASAIRIAGLIEDIPEDGAGCGPGRLRRLTDGQAFRLYQDLGTAAVSCALDAESLIDVGQRVCADIAAGCDLAVLSKFGKLEAENRSGLIPAFAAAIERGIPVLTSVSPKHAAAWAAFADPLFVVLPPEMAALEDWFRLNARSGRRS